MEFLANHVDRHQQVTVLKDELAIRYAKLQMQYEALHKEMLDYKTRANYWQAQFNKFKSREDELKAEIEGLKAKLRKREQQLFGKKSEQGASSQDQFNQSQTKSTNKKKKGQQPGSKGHGKRNYDHLPAVEETVGLFENDALCPCCGLPYEELAGTEDSEVLEVIKETVVYKIEKTRSSKVLIDYFGSDHEGGTLNVDRYSAYKVIAKSGLFILAFCWAHVRRDFLNYSKEYPNNEAFGLLWVDKINHLYHINNQRIQYEAGSKEFNLHHQNLKNAISAMKEAMEQTLKATDLLPSAKKLLISLNKHWSGLTVFVDHPEIFMDNNTAERGLRGSVVGRKNYYGSGAVWSAELAAALFTIFGTLKLWGLNVHTWLLGYFYECALLGGEPPEDIQKYLPWNMTEKQKQLFSEPPKHEDTG